MSNGGSKQGVKIRIGIEKEVAGIAGGKGEAVLFEHGQIVGKIPDNEIIDALAARIKEKYM